MYDLRRNIVSKNSIVFYLWVLDWICTMLTTRTHTRYIYFTNVFQLTSFEVILPQLYIFFYIFPPLK